MSLPLTDEQQEIRAVARRFLDATFTSDALRAAARRPGGVDDEAWQHVAELGWPAMAIAEEHGGLAFGQVERCLLLEAMGRVLAPLPFLSSAVLATDALALGASADASAALLAKAAEGDLRLALVAWGDLHAGADAAGDVEASARDGAWVLDGDGGVALDAGSAERLIVVARVADGFSLHVLDARSRGVELAPFDQMDPTRRFARVAFAGAPAERLDEGGVDRSTLAEILDRGRLALAAEMAGAATRCVDMTVEYAKERRQFGVPIGSFQVIKHRCADMAIEADAACEVMLLAAETADAGERDGAALLARSAKTAAADALALAAATAVQVHGGIGFTEEHDAQLFFKRAHVSQRLLGSTGALREGLADRLGV